MILQALASYYDILAADPDCPIARQGYSTTSARFALMLSETGELLAILPLVQTQLNGKKTVEVALRMIVPEQAKRAGTKPSANFLCDSCAYVLGISERDEKEPKYAAQRFEAFRELHLRLLDGVNCPEARAVTAFLKAHDPKQARAHPLVAEKLDELLTGSGNLVFMLEGRDGFVHEAPVIRRVWEASRDQDGEEGQCLITGQRMKIARLHPAFQGIRGAQQAGATLVGFNAPAYESYNRAKGQGWNAPTGEQATFAYATALKFLLSRESETPKFLIGDTTVIYWAESSNRAYMDTFAALFDPDWAAAETAAPQRDLLATERIRAIAEKVKSGAPIDTTNMLEGLDPQTRFYVLGLAPNAARLSVRFFYADAFQAIVNRIMAHYQDMSIQREFENQPIRLSLRAILDETVSKKATNSSPSPLMAGAVMRAVLNNTPYPAALFSAIITRIRADMDDSKAHIRKINYPRAAVIKACLTRKYRNQPHAPIQEVLCMALNEQSTHPAYLLGRLFAVLEKAQADAIGDVNASIKDRYFTTACASPAIVFPVLLRLAQHHINKAEYGYMSDRRIEEILGLLKMDQNPIPRHLSLDEQGIFVLGYYHQRATFFARKNGDAKTEITSTNVENE